MASTYVNDLRLNEMGTGDASGTWGTTTNTNLELIGEAFGYGTEGITTNADTHTSTIADGATDPVRAMYVKYTGTLDSACTITIAPNTINRMHFIENGTSGSQNIIISQGSGANVTIAPGTSKAVYLDGAGSGAAVVDAFASLAVVDLTVDDDLTVTDDILLNSDAGIIKFGADSEVTLTHVADKGLALKHTATADDKPVILTLQTGETDIAANDVIGKIEFQAPDEGAGTDAVLVSGAIQAVSEGDFSSSSNATKLEFMTGASETATTKMTLSSGGVLDCDGGITVDNITIDGTEIDLSSGNLLIDVEGVLILDTNGGEIQIKDDGTEIASLQNSSSDFKIEAKVQDKDMIFGGNDGGSGITALTLDMSEAGAATFNNNVTAFSDERLKSDIETIEHGLDKVEQMRGVTYIRNDNEKGGQQVGVIAQEIEEILPQVVLTADDEMGTKSVDYGKITAVLIEAVKELSAKVKELENK
jgi:hypothetical protein